MHIDTVRVIGKTVTLSVVWIGVFTTVLFTQHPIVDVIAASLISAVVAAVITASWL